MIRSCGISKEVAGGGINNGEVGGKYLTGDLVEEAEFEMEKSAQIKVLCGKIRVIRYVRSLGNKTVTVRVREFGDRIGKTGVYPKFLHL